MANNSAPVTVGEPATAEQYNDLRADVLDATTGHDHGGNGGVPIPDISDDMMVYVGFGEGMGLG